jgi:hypothetical protein
MGLYGKHFSVVQLCVFWGTGFLFCSLNILSGTRHPITYWRRRGAGPTRAHITCSQSTRNARYRGPVS